MENTLMHELVGRLAGKVALVTGAGSGIGKVTALRFAAEGAAVALAGRREAELTAVANMIGDDGGRAIAIPTDVSDEAAIDALVARVVADFGSLDIAFNNAGVLGALKPITELRADEFDTVIATNLRGVWRLASCAGGDSSHAGGRMRRQHRQYVVLRGPGRNGRHIRLCREQGRTGRHDPCACVRGGTKWHPREQCCPWGDTHADVLWPRRTFQPGARGPCGAQTSRRAGRDRRRRPVAVL